MARRSVRRWACVSEKRGTRQMLYRVHSCRECMESDRCRWVYVYRLPVGIRLVQRTRYSNDLLAACIEDSKEKGKKGLCILSSAKKKPFLADPKYLTHKGFSVCDEADNGIQLWYLPFTSKEIIPKFKECARHPHVNESGYVLFYTSQCPFNAKYVPIVEQTAKEHGIAFKAIHIERKEDAQNAPTPITTYALFYNGEYLTNEQMNEAKFLKLSAR